MKINLKQAVKYFFANPSLELVYMEAISNSLDAGATKIDIAISIEEFNKPDTLKIKIEDNGEGFTDERFGKFCKLMEVEEASHKGLGRLVFLSYFQQVNVVSKYEGNIRTFNYWNEFDEKSNVTKSGEIINGTTLNFNGYYLSKIKTHAYITPSTLRKRILEYFYPKLYSMKQEEKELLLTITLYINNPDTENSIQQDKQLISLDDIIELKVEPIDSSLVAMFENMEVHYSVTLKRQLEKTLITALCIDGRTYHLDLLTDDNMPLGYEAIFLLYSSIFTGKVDGSRQELTIDDSTLKTIKKIFQSKIAEILKKEIPSITESNRKTREEIADTYPHLIGYFEEETIGFVKRETTIKQAQERFFKAQKEVLEAGTVSDEIYEKSLEMSSRALTEYVLYREVIIKKLKETAKLNDEADIHKLIVPLRTKLHKANFMSDLYTNNVWLLDDKYMTFNTILSDKVMSQVVKEITKDEVTNKDNTEADLAIIFSNNPDTTAKVDVVIVEIKKRGVPLEENVKAIVQLQQRAIKLMQYYPDKIQRIWFYAVVEFNDELKLWLENNKFTELFSKDALYYREDEIKLSLQATATCPMGIFILSMDSLIQDAEDRNLTFLRILKEAFSKEQRNGQ